MLGGGALFGGNPFSVQQQQQNSLAAMFGGIGQEIQMQGLTWNELGSLERTQQAIPRSLSLQNVTDSFIDKLRNEIDEWLKL